MVPRGGVLRDGGGSRMASPDPALKVARSHFCHVLLVAREPSFKERGFGLHLSRGQCCEGHLWKTQSARGLEKNTSYYLIQNNHNERCFNQAPTSIELITQKACFHNHLLPHKTPATSARSAPAPSLRERQMGAKGSAQEPESPTIQGFENLRGLWVQLGHRLVLAKCQEFTSEPQRSGTLGYSETNTWRVC